MLKILLTALSVSAFSSAEKAGISVGIDHKFVKYATNQIGPEIVRELNALKLDNFTLPNGAKISNIVIDYQVGNPEDFQINYDHDFKAIDLRIDNIMGDIIFDLNFSSFIIGSFSGTVDMEMISGGASIQSRLDISGTRDGERLFPSLNLAFFDTDLPAENFKVQVSPYDSSLSEGLSEFLNELIPSLI